MYYKSHAQLEKNNDVVIFDDIINFLMQDCEKNNFVKFFKVGNF